MFFATRLITGIALAALAAIAQATPANEDSARAENLMTEGLKLLGQRTPEALHQAAADYQEAADLWQKVGDSSKKLEALLNLAGAHFYLHEISEASALLNQALDLARASGSRAGEGTALVSLAMLHDNSGDRQKAIDELIQARKIFEALGDKNAELQVVSMQGRAFEMAKDFPAAIEAYERGLALSREASNSKVEAIMLLRLAQMNQILPQPEASEKAAALFAQAVPLLQANSDRLNETVAWWGLGMTNDKLGRMDQARDAYLKALPLLADLKNFPAGGRIKLSLAIDEEKLQQTQKAIEHYEQALPLLASAHDQFQDGKDPQRAAALLAVGDSYNALHESKKALDYLKQALTLNEQEPAGKATALTKMEMGEVYYGMGDQTTALQLQNEALAIVRSDGEPSRRG